MGLQLWIRKEESVIIERVKGFICVLELHHLLNKSHLQMLLYVRDFSIQGRRDLTMEPRK